MPVGAAGVLVPVPMFEPTESITILGEKTNLAMFWGDAMAEVRTVSQRAATLIRASAPKYEAVRIWKMLLESSVIYKVLLASVSDEELQDATSDAWTALRSTLGLARSTSHALTRAALGDISTECNIRRVTTLIRILTGADEGSKEAAEAYIHNHGKLMGVVGTPA